MRYATLIVACLAFARPLSAQRPSADSAAIVALEHELIRLLAERRIDEYATHLTSDYARTNEDGTIEGREAALASWRATPPGGMMKPSELWVRVYGDAAVLTGVITEPGPGSHRSRMTKTFVRQQGHWLLAALHGSAIAPR